jgi:type VI secretion system protein ImpH
MVGLERMVACHFDVPATIVPFRGVWETIEDTDVTRIGNHKGQHQILGHGAAIGKRVWDPEASFEVRLGAMSRSQFMQFLPKRFCFRSAVSMVRFYAGEDVGFTFRLVLRGAEIPELKLGRKGGAMLGWTSWLHTRPSATDDAQVTLRGNA